MKKSIILVAGLVIACAFCAGLPAAAADNPPVQQTAPAPVPSATPATPVATPQTTAEEPWYAPIAGWFGIHQQAGQATAQQAVTAGDTGSQKEWWESLWPPAMNSSTGNDIIPANTQADPAAVTTPADPANKPGDPGNTVPADQQDRNNQKVIQKVPQTS